MAKRQYNKGFINKDNLIIALKYMLDLQSQYQFNNPRLNENIYNLHHMLSELNCDNRGHYFTCFDSINGKQNKLFPDLRERYIHISYNDPCSLKHEIKELILAGTNTVEVDISNTAVYLFAKFISHDDDLLNYYKHNDFYKLLPNKTRDEQKKLTQIWLQGIYNKAIPYNSLFPITGEYLKQTAIADNELYKRNSGLFRDQEVKLLDEIIADMSVLFHLHDGFYTTERNKKKLCASVEKHYGDGIKYKVHDFSNVCLTENEIKNIINNVEWKSDGITPQVENIKSNNLLFNAKAKYNYIYADTHEDASAYVVQRLYAISLNNIVQSSIMAGIATNPVYIIK